MIFGSNRDFNLLLKVNRELLKDVVEQEILLYKYDLNEIQGNIYGEATSKQFLPPVKLNCLITRGDQVVTNDEFGPDLIRDASFALLRQDLNDSNVFPEVGDIIMWQEDYYETDTVRENELFLGRDKSYNLTSYGEKFGTSLSIILDCHLTRREKVGITFEGTQL
tara:strand:+ start:11644 stop:12138 length:495 start_codon:yes stop_codon:yes gene_type:complete